MSDETIFRASPRATSGQPLDSDLTAIAALTTTAFGRGLLDDADAAAARTTLALGSAAVEAAAETATASTVVKRDANADAAVRRVSVTDQIDSTAALTIAPTVSVGAVGKAASFRAGAAPAGFVGGNMLIGPGDGGTLGTNAPGNLIFEMGTAVSSASGKTIWQEAGTQIAVMQRTGSGVTLRAGTGNVLSGSSGTVPCNLEGSSASVSALTSFVVVAAATDLFLRHTGDLIHDTGGVAYGRRRHASVTIATAATDNVMTYATAADTAYAVEAVLTVTNNTSNVVSVFRMCAVFERNGGTLTQSGAKVDIVAPVVPLGEVGLTATLDFSGTDIRVRWTRPDTNNRTAKLTFKIHPAAIT